MDTTKQCVEEDCGQEFAVTEGEEKFYSQKGLSLPKRCKPCRERKKQRNLENQ